MNLNKTAISTTVIVLVVVLVVVVIAAGSYVALNPGGTATTTATSIATSTATSIATSTATSTAVSTVTSTAVSTVTSNSYIGAATLSAGGGTLVYPLMEAWINTYAYVQPNVQVSYQAVGSGTGIKDITSGLVTIGESDAPLSVTQYAGLPSGSNLLTIPISDSGIIPAYNLPAPLNTVHLNFTGNVLAEIFYGSITMWNDHRIAALQSPSVAAELPAHAIQVYHRSDGSGTMYGFTQFLSDSNATWKAKVGYSTQTLPWPVGIGCLHNAGVADCIATTPYSIGPLEIAYEIANPGQINYGAVRNGYGNYIVANLTNISQALAAAVKSGLPTTDAQWTPYSVIQATFNDTSDKYIYPVATFTYALVYQDLSAAYASTSQAQAVAALNFLSWIVNDGQGTGPYSSGATLGYPPLPSAAVTLDNTLLATITYNGTPVL